MSTPDRNTWLKLDRSHRVNEKVQARAVAFSPDGSLIAVAYASFGTHAFSNKVLIWNLLKWRQVKLLRGCSGNVDDIAFTPDGKHLLCVGGTKNRFMGGELTAWAVHTWKAARTIEGEDVHSLRRVAGSPDGRLWAAGSALSGGGDMDKLYLWDADTGSFVRGFGQIPHDIQGLAFSPDGDSLAVGVGGDRTVSIWSVADGECRWRKRAHTEANELPVVFSSDGSILASCGDRNVALWDTKSGKRRGLFKGHGANVRALAFSRDGAILFSAGSREIFAWDIASGQELGSQSFPDLNFVGVRSAEDGMSLTAVHTINAELEIQR